MCTVTYLPFGSEGFLLTSSRDEQLTRPTACLPTTEPISDHWVTFPKDPQGQGSWIAASDRWVVCLLNGAFDPHQYQPPYKHSRGLVPLAVFQYKSLDHFIQQYPFDGLEPFTLLLAEVAGPSDGRLIELRWDGKHLHRADKDPAQPHIWSSATLYPAPVRAERERWFVEWLASSETNTVDTIRQFHKTGGQQDSTNAIQMHRPGKYRTVSLTTVEFTPHQTSFHYEDLVAQVNTRQHLSAPAYATT